ncbi:hypothetical protein HanIR_Chr16g0787891 [Helianthus annuus]|nr:hypothetical protein HanIR_Chr16g0787891 [Helianthus annuus]
MNNQTVATLQLTTKATRIVKKKITQTDASPTVSRRLPPFHTLYNPTATTKKNSGRKNLDGYGATKHQRLLYDGCVAAVETMTEKQKRDDWVDVAAVMDDEYRFFQICSIQPFNPF